MTAAAKPFRGIGADHDGERWPRTQREAGIEFMPWESRITVLTPWTTILLRTALIALAGPAILALAAMVAGAL